MSGGSVMKGGPIFKSERKKIANKLVTDEELNEILNVLDKIKNNK